MLFARVKISLLFITAVSITSSLALLGVLPLDTSWLASSEWRLEAEVNVLLRVQTDNERRNVDNLDKFGLKQYISLTKNYSYSSVKLLTKG